MGKNFCYLIIFRNILLKFSYLAFFCVYNRSECFCGAVEPPSSAKLPDSSCNMKCPADPRQACGGFYTVNIYQTGVASKCSTHEYGNQIPFFF